MTPQFETSEAVTHAATQPDANLFSNLFAGSVAEAKAAFDKVMKELDILPYIRGGIGAALCRAQG